MTSKGVLSNFRAVWQSVILYVSQVYAFDTTICRLHFSLEDRPPCRVPLQVHF